MSAPQRLPETLAPIESPHRMRRRQKRQAHSLHQGTAIEAGTALCTNTILLSLVMAGLFRVIPVYQYQQEKLQELQAEVNVTENRVGRLESDFVRYFDPRETKQIMQEQGFRLDPHQRRIVWLDEATSHEMTE